MRQLFELCGADTDVRFSPYVWRNKLMLLHKDLSFESVPITFLEKDPLATSGSKTVPVLNDDGTWVKESFDIACYLDDTYPQNSLFGGKQAQAQARLMNEWINRTLVMGIFPMIVADIQAVLDAKNAAYFAETREKFLGCSLAEAQSGREAALPKFHKSLAPMRAVLEQQKFLGGDAPAWADYAAAGTLVWPHVASAFDVVPEDGPIRDWWENMQDLFDGAVRNTKRGV